MTSIPVQGEYDPSKGILLFNISDLINGKPNEGEPRKALIPQQSGCIRTPNLDFCFSVLRVIGGISLIVSCVSSVLLPAIGSIGVIAIVCLAKRKIVPLHTKKLPSEADKAQRLFPKSAMNHSQPLSSSTCEIAQNHSNGQVVPPPPFPLKEFQVASQESSTNSSSVTKNDIIKPALNNKPDFLKSIQQGISLKFNIQNAERTLLNNPGLYPSDLLLKELKSTYERALGISKSEKLEWTSYFTNKLKDFDKDFAVKNESEVIENSNMEDICKKTSGLTSLLENMQWIKSLLKVLSQRTDLSNKSVQKYCSNKCAKIDEHIKKLEDSNKKQLGQGKIKEIGDSREMSGSTPSLQEAILHEMNKRFTGTHGDSESDTRSELDDNRSDWDGL